jgi:hypothetical protein
MKRFAKIYLFFISGLYLLVTNPRFVYAQPDLGLDNSESLNMATSGSGDIITNIVKLLLSFCGVMAVTIFIFGYFNLMVSSGNDDKEHEAKMKMISSAIGLVLIITSYLMVGFVFQKVGAALSLPANAGFEN